MPNVRLDTRSRRFFFVFLLVFIISGVAFTTLTERIIKPERWYSYTVESRAIDIRSPTGTQIIDFGFIGYNPTNPYVRHCGDNNEGQRSLVVGAQYRGVWLCNPAGISRQDFKAPHSYFQRRVDELYSEYYWRFFERTFLGFIYGIGAWISLFAAFLTFRWINRGSPNA